MNHLPECPSTSTDPLAEDCCCSRLHACERRVHKIAYAQGLGAGSDEHRKHAIGWFKGYNAALNDAREAIEALPREDGGYCFVLHACDVEATIDDLKVKNSGQ
jgi:hypothetical protein